MNQAHKNKITEISSKVKEYYNNRVPFHIYHGSTNSTRIITFKRKQMIDVSNLNRVLSVDCEKMSAIIEPNVPMDKLVRKTLKYNLVPPVIMEFPGITVGGGIQGAAAESSSFKWGCFSQTFNWYEIVLANGETITASPQNNGDLFHGTAGSYGTLGIITAAEIKLAPAHKFVKLTYIPVNSFEAAIATTEKSVSQKYDYIDGIMFSDKNGVIIVGNMIDEVISHKQRFSRAHDPWFYLHAEKISQQKEQVTETVPLVDYLFRYDRGAFWVGKYAFDIFNKPFTPFMRWLLNPILHTRKLYQALQESGVSQKYLVQDMTVPLSNAIDFMQFIDKKLNIYPLWILPMKPDSLSSLEPNNIKTPLAINIGIWGNKVESYAKFVSLNKLLENELRLLRGKKVLYAQSFYTEKEFWDIYDKDDYQKLRLKYHAENLQDVFKKTRVNTEYDVNLKRGLYRTLFRQAKLRIDNK